MRRAQQGSIRFLQLLMAGSIALPVILFIYASALSYQSTFRVADERIQRSLNVAAEHASYLFRASDILLEATNDLIGARPDGEIEKQEADYHDALNKLAQRLPQIYSVWLFAADGRPLVSSRVFPVPKTFANRDRDYFEAQIPKDAGLFIGGIVPPKLPGMEIFSLSRRRPGTKFNGVVAIAIHPADIQEFYRSISADPGSYFALLRGDGLFLAREPKPVALGLRLNEASSTRRAIAQQPVSGIISTVSQTDGVERRIGYQRVDGFPAYVLAGETHSYILYQWLSLMASHLIFGIPATAVMFAAILYGLRRTKKLYAEASAREQAEAALRQAQKMDAIGQLSGGVAHDFNNLLTIVLGNLAVAKKGLERNIDAVSARTLRAIENAIQGAERAATLTKRLLAFARQQPLSPTVVDVNATIQNAIPLLQRALGESLRLEVVGAAGVWNIEVDAGQLEIALLNLVINSRDAMPGNGKVTVECSNSFLDDAYAKPRADVRTGQYVVVAVSDTGKGMSQDVIATAFDPFFTTKPAGKGTGLGLSQVYGFVKQSGGHVSIYSEIGKGTTVKMYFPRVHREAVNQPGRIRSAEIQERGNGERILVVEDDAQVRSFVAETLAGLNYEVTQAPTGEEALRILESGLLLDVLLTDVILPGMNGRELAGAVQKIRPTVKVLFMTGYSRNAIVHHGRLDVGVLLLQKPFSVEELSTRVRQALASRPEILAQTGSSFGPM